MSISNLKSCNWAVKAIFVYYCLAALVVPIICIIRIYCEFNWLIALFLIVTYFLMFAFSLTLLTEDKIPISNHPLNIINLFLLGSLFAASYYTIHTLFIEIDEGYFFLFFLCQVAGTGLFLMQSLNATIPCLESSIYPKKIFYGKSIRVTLTIIVCFVVYCIVIPSFDFGYVKFFKGLLSLLAIPFGFFVLFLVMGIFANDTLSVKKAISKPIKEVRNCVYLEAVRLDDTNIEDQKNLANLVSRMFSVQAKMNEINRDLKDMAILWAALAIGLLDSKNGIQKEGMIKDTFFLSLSGCCFACCEACINAEDKYSLEQAALLYAPLPYFRQKYFQKGTESLGESAIEAINMHDEMMEGYSYIFSRFKEIPEVKNHEEAMSASIQALKNIINM